MLNKVILIGRITRDLELRHTGTGKEVANFTIAIDEGYGEKKKTEFVNCVVWGKLAENCSKYIGKGRLVAVEGRLQTRKHEDKKYTEVIADNVKFLDRAKNETQVEVEGDDLPF